ncbi:MAG: hypothetical protein IPJ03_05645 [Ignavibacteriales bacterium]|nr:hypothetical protein [Ignavibacteriales bacterium]
MKKSAKPFLLFAVTSILLITAIFLLAVGLKINYEEMTKEKDKMEQTLNAAKLRKIELTAEFQSVTSPENIIPAALSLGLIQRTLPQQLVYADSEKIENINLILREKYE